MIPALRIGCLLLSVTFTLYGQQGDPSDLTGPYLGQKPPGMKPEIFAPGIVSTDEDEINAVFQPDRMTIYFCRDTYSNLSKAGKDYTIYYMRSGQNGWTKPQIVPFAGEYMNADVALAADGRQLFFCSDRPVRKGETRKKDADIWMVDILPDGWSEPLNLGPAINSDKNEWYPCLAKNGTLYFSSSREGGQGQSDIYRSKQVNGKFQPAEPLTGMINTKYSEGDVYIAPDESFLIVVSSNRPDTIGKGDLYISYQNRDYNWSRAVHLGKNLNSTTHDYCPMISPDFKYLFFTSSMNGNDDIYWVNARIIEALTPEEFIKEELK